MAPLGKLLLRSPRYGINAASVPLGPGIPVYLRITDIDDSGRFAPDPKVGVDHPKTADYRMRPGELVIARTGASVGKSYLYNPRDGQLVYAGFLINVAPDPALLNPKYLAAYVQSKAYWDWIARMSARSGQPGINARELGQLPVPLPDIIDQNSIAEAAATADDFILGLERLIEKKEAVSSGIRQQLLTGETRLPGFHDEWRTTTLDTLGTFMKGRGVKRLDVRSSGVPCIRYGELYTTFSGYTSRTVSFVAPEVAESALPLEKGDLLFAGSGETREEIGECVAYTGSEPAVAGGDIVVLRGEGFNPVFMALMMNSPEIVRQKARAGQGDAVVHIYSQALSRIEVRLPSRPEQDAIADVMVSADTEIELLRRRLTKARAVKEGMMQELLTGRTRLALRTAAA